jgi:hypothetical protein
MTVAEMIEMIDGFLASGASERHRAQSEEEVPLADRVRKRDI